MEVRVNATAEATAHAAAQWLSDALKAASAARGRVSLALSGGRTPWVMLEALDEKQVPWSALTVYQVDERAVPVDDERRNGRRIAGLLVGPGRLDADRFVPMVAENPDLAMAAAGYAQRLVDELGGDPPVLDIVQLGLGADAHTASLIPGDPLLEEGLRNVGAAEIYQGTRRLSLTFRVLNAARQRLWLVTGADKAAALRALVDGDSRYPCGRVLGASSIVFADEAAAAELTV
jgi:6-phosphogluconolactonase